MAPQERETVGQVDQPSNPKWPEECKQPVLKRRRGITSREAWDAKHSAKKREWKNRLRRHLTQEVGEALCQSPQELRRGPNCESKPQDGRDTEVPHMFAQCVWFECPRSRGNSKSRI